MQEKARLGIEAQGRVQWLNELIETLKAETSPPAQALLTRWTSYFASSNVSSRRVRIVCPSYGGGKRPMM